MEEAETASVPSRKELRKQKLMEYLAAKGKLKQPNPRPYLRDDCQVKKPVTSAVKVMGKENSAPTNKASFKHNKVTTLAAQSTTHPARRVFGASNIVNVKSSSLSQCQNTSHPSATCGSVPSKLNPVCSNKNLNTASHFKRQANTGIISSDRACSNAAGTALKKSNTRVITSSKAMWSCPIKAVSVRMSLGPVVKTKTGLIPAVIQPRNSQNSAHSSATAFNTTTNTTSSVSVSKRSGLAHRITLPSTALNIPITKRTTVLSTARAEINVQDQSKFDSKQLLSKHSGPLCKSKLQSGLKSTSSSFKCTAPPVKPKGKEGILKSDKPVGQPTDMTTKLRSEGELKKNIQQSRVASRTSSGPPSSRVISGVTRAAVTELGEKNKKCYDTYSKKGLSSANVPPPLTERKKSGAPMMSHTMPRLAKTISHTGQTTDMKTKKVPVRVFPHTENKKMTAAQEERMRKLQEWREAKGISYKRPSMQVKPQVRRTIAVPQPFWAAMKEEDDAHSLICAVDRSLVDCIKLLDEGCPPDQVKEVLSRLPVVSQKFAKYWICKARLMELEGNLDVLPMFEEAVRVVLEPVDELRTVVFEILKKKDEFQDIKCFDDSRCSCVSALLRRFSLKGGSRPRSLRSEARRRHTLIPKSSTDSTLQLQTPVITEERHCGDIMAPHTELYVLKIKEGKFVTVQSFKDGLKLCAVEHQEKNAPQVRIWRRERNKRNQMALCFQRGKDYYFPKVDGNSLMLEMRAEDNLGNSENISDSYWFEKKNSGNAEHYSLQSVIKPEHYLSIQSKKKQSIFVLSKALSKCVQVQDKKIE